MRKAMFALAALGSVWMASDARASVSLTVVFDALLEESTAVGVVVPIEESSMWEGGRIVTYTHVRVDDVLSGSADHETWIRALGGVVGDIGQQVEGEATFTMGARYIVFLKPTSNGGGAMTVSARRQGEFPLKVDDATQALHVADHLRPVELPPRTDIVRRIQARAPLDPNAARPAAEILAGKSVEDTRKLVASAWQRTHASR